MTELDEMYIFNLYIELEWYVHSITSEYVYWIIHIIELYEMYVLYIELLNAEL